jgi:hypothetical protein
MMSPDLHDHVTGVSALALLGGWALFRRLRAELAVVL